MLLQTVAHAYAGRASAPTGTVNVTGPQVTAQSPRADAAISQCAQELAGLSPIVACATAARKSAIAAVSFAQSQRADAAISQCAQEPVELLPIVAHATAARKTAVPVNFAQSR